MDKDQQIKELSERVAQLEEENHQLQSMLQKVIKKYQRLSEQQPKNKEPEKSKKSKKQPKQPSESSPLNPSSEPSSDLEYSLKQNIEFDNLSFVKSVLPSINVNYNFQSSGTHLVHEAVKSGAIKVLNFLCAQGADLNLTTTTGESPLTLGAEENKHDAMCIILQHGREKVDLEYHNASGMNALQIAVKNGNKEIVGLLAAHGANVNVTNFLGDSLIKIAQRSGHQEIVMLLINAGASLR
jgi:uncharacterized coiled-coil protein SlyX